MALKNCEECGRQISDLAAACPHCGAPNAPVASKGAVASSKNLSPAFVAVAFVMVGFLIWGMAEFTSSPDGQTPPAPGSTPQLSDADCRKDLQCWGHKAVSSASVYCEKPIEKLAVHSARWTDGTFEMKFDRYGWLDEKAGTLKMVGDKVEFQNGYGAYDRMHYVCEFDPISKKVLYVDASPGPLPE